MRQSVIASARRRPSSSLRANVRVLTGVIFAAVFCILSFSAQAASAPSLSVTEDWLNATFATSNVPGITYGVETNTRRRLTTANFKACLMTARAQIDTKSIGKAWRVAGLYTYRIPGEKFSNGKVEDNALAPAELSYYVEGTFHKDGSDIFPLLSSLGVYFADAKTAYAMKSKLDLWSALCRLPGAPRPPE